MLFRSGHEFGDKYIQIAADVFMDSVPDGTVVSRPGGEPFPLHLSAGVAWYPGYDRQQDIYAVCGFCDVSD